MYVCLCNSIRCSDVRSAAGAGASTPGGVYRHMGCRPQCGRCRDAIVDLLTAPDPLGVQPRETAAFDRDARR